MSHRKFSLLGIAISLAVVGLLLPATVAYATFSSLTWTAVGPGTKTVTPSSGGSVTFGYTFGQPSFEPLQTWTFSAPAPQTATVTFNWTYSGFHGWFLDRAVLKAFANGPSGTTTVTLVNTPNCEFCSGEIDGPFGFSGTASLPLTAGQTFGITIQGSNFDCCARLEGTVTLTPSTPPDTTAPVVTPPANLIAEATSAAGATVTYSNATATDNVGVTSGPTCAPASGSTFPLGTTTVTCTAGDAVGNIGSASFTVTVVDTTPPVLTLPANITTTINSTSGATVSYSASASDLVSGAVTPSCAPASGSTFPVGTATVNCTATDGAGNSASGSFTVTVTVTYGSLCQVTKQVVSKEGVANSLCAKLEAAAAAEARGNANAKAGALGAYKNELKAQSGKAVSAADAAGLSQLADSL